LGRGKRKRERGPAGEGEKGEGTWAGPRRGFGLPTFILSPLLFFFYTPLFQTNLIEFKIQFEFNSINSTQSKPCCGMNAQTLLIL
jgi:hypothetical protein